METRHLSLRKTAEVFGMSSSHLSESVRAGKAPKGVPLQDHVVYSEDGRISHFEVPLAMLPEEYYGDDGGEESSPEANGRTADGRTNDRSGGTDSDDDLISIRVKGSSERENPDAGAVADALMGGALSGVAREIVSEMIGAVRQLFEDAEPGQAMMIGQGIKGFALDAAPLVTGGVAAYMARKRSPVAYVSAFLLTGAGTELLLKGDDSRFVQAFKAGIPRSVHEPTESQASQPQSDMEDSSEDIPSTVGDGEMGDGVPLDVDVGLDRHGSEADAQSSSAKE